MGKDHIDKKEAAAVPAATDEDTCTEGSQKTLTPLDDLVEEVSEGFPPGLGLDLKSIVEKLPDQEKAQFVNILAIQQNKYRGSYPYIPSELLRQYKEIDLNFAEQIMAQSLAEQNHRHQQEEKALDADIALEQYEVETSRQVQTRGQRYALAIGITAFIAAIIAIVLGSPFVAGVFGAAGITGLVTAFLQSSKANIAEDDSEDSGESEQ